MLSEHMVSSLFDAGSLRNCGIQRGVEKLKYLMAYHVFAICIFIRSNIYAATNPET